MLYNLTLTGDELVALQDILPEFETDADIEAIQNKISWIIRPPDCFVPRDGGREIHIWLEEIEPDSLEEAPEVKVHFGSQVDRDRWLEIFEPDGADYSDEVPGFCTFKDSKKIAYRQALGDTITYGLHHDGCLLDDWRPEENE